MIILLITLTLYSTSTSANKTCFYCDRSILQGKCEVAPECGSNFTFIEMIGEYQYYIKLLHNSYRRRLARGNSYHDWPLARNLNDLKWYSSKHGTLKQIAECAVKLCDRSNKHEIIYNKKGYRVGFNKFAMPGRVEDTFILISNAVDEWYSGGISCDANVMLPYSAMASKRCSQFTQIVWSNSTQLYCAGALLSNESVVYCFYYPTGNIPGHQVYETRRIPYTKCGNFSSGVDCDIIVQKMRYDSSGSNANFLRAALVLYLFVTYFVD